MAHTNIKKNYLKKKKFFFKYILKQPTQGDEQ